MEHIYEKKLARAIGVTNFRTDQLDRIMSSSPRVPIHCQQVELHLHFPQWEMQATCRRWNIALTAYAPLGSPGRADIPSPPGLKSDWEVGAAEPLKNALVVQLAGKYGKTPAQVLLRHLIQRGVAMVPKSLNPGRIMDNLQVCACCMDG